MRGSGGGQGNGRNSVYATREVRPTPQLTLEMLRIKLQENKTL
jgi:hypothetical protein